MNKNKISQPKYSNNIFLSINFTQKKEVENFDLSKNFVSLTQKASKNPLAAALAVPLRH